MDIKYYLKEPKRKEETAIFARCHFGYKEETTKGKHEYKPVKIYIGVKIKPEFWNAGKNRAKETIKFPQYPEFNDKLNTTKSELKALFFDLSKKHKIVTPELFKKEWNLKNNPLPLEPEPINSFVTFAENQIKQLTGNIANGTLKNFNNSLGHIKDFIETKQKPITIDEIGFEFNYELTDYLKSVKQFAPNTIWRINKYLKYVLKYATEMGLKTRPDYMSKRFSVPVEEVETVYLNENELSKIYNVNLTSDKLQRVRDLFLISCYTGLRFSDLMRVTLENIKTVNEKYFIKIITQKTTTLVEIPLNPICTEIVNKYSGLPKGMSNQKFNDYLKEVAKKAKINTPITIEETKGNLTTKKTVLKHTLITSHAGRRSFATNAFKAGIDPITIMLITGHKTETAFLRYIRITKEENAQLLSKHDHFNKPILKRVK